MIEKFIIGVFSFSFLFTLQLIFPCPASARIELSFSAPPSSIQVDQPFSVDVTLTGADPAAEYYIRGVLFKPETTQYFGFTQNDQGNWHSNSGEPSAFYKLQGNGTKTISFTVDTSSSQYVPNQSYSFKIGRYTQAGSLTWSDQSPSSVMITQTESPSPTPTVSEMTQQTPSPTASPTSPPSSNTIFLSEIMACPNSSDSEWVELYNTSNSITVNLQDWKLRDSSTSHDVALAGEIAPVSYFALTLNSSIYNNAGDSVKLINPAGDEIDAMSYEDCVANTSLIKKDNQWQYTTTVTKQQANVFTGIIISPTPTNTLTVSTSPKFSEKEVQEKIDTDSTEIRGTNINQYHETITLFPQMSADASATATTQSEQHSSTLAESAPQETSSSARQLPFILGGSSYILCAALLAQKWYTLLSA